MTGSISPLSGGPQFDPSNYSPPTNGVAQVAALGNEIGKELQNILLQGLQQAIEEDQTQAQQAADQMKQSIEDDS